MAYLYEDPCILIGGAARSGTTLVGTILARHPKAAILLEERLTNVVLAVERLCSIRTLSEESERTTLFGAPRSFLSLPLWEGEDQLEKLGSLHPHSVRFSRLFRAVFEAVTDKTNASVVGSKLPIGQDWEDLDFLQQRLSDLRIILTVRNPLDVISSSMVRARNAELGLDEWLIRNVQSACDQWLLAMATMKRVLDLASPLKVLVVKYEDLCAFPEGEERRIRGFASLPSGDEPPVSRASIDGRSILSAEDITFLRDELGEIDLAWLNMTAEQTLHHYSKIIRHLPLGDASLANGAHGWILASGFGDAEHWGRWTDGRRATLRFRLPDVRSRTRLGLDVAMARIPVGREGAPLSICINGGAPSLGLAKPGERLYVDLPANDPPDRAVTVEIDILEPKPPDEAPFHDPRQLGIGLTGLSLHADERGLC